MSSYLRFLLEAVCTATLTHALELSHVAYDISRKVQETISDEKKASVPMFFVVNSKKTTS